MDKTTKIVLIVIGVIVVLCACGVVTVFVTGWWSYNTIARVSEHSVSEIPQEAVRVGAEVADYVVPAGFGSPFSIHFGDVTVIGYKSASERSHLLLAQFPEGTRFDMDEMLRRIQQIPGDSNNVWSNTELTLVEQRPVTIRGQETVLSISEGTSSDDVPYRTATATFQGRGGPALVMVAGPVGEWDNEMVEEFIISIQ